jgi:hypothetical protein
MPDFDKGHVEVSEIAHQTSIEVRHQKFKLLQLTQQRRTWLFDPGCSSFMGVKN